MSSMIAKRIVICTVLLLCLQVGCTGLPQYAQPHISPVSGPMPVHVIPYRNLLKSDFQAKELPEYIREHSHKLNAHTSVSIRPVSQSKYIVTSSDFYGAQVYFASVEQLAFEAVMIPERSWWNPAAPRRKDKYILQHEQIHFALMEVTARRLSEKAMDESASLIAIDSSYEAARAGLLTIIETWIKDAQVAALEEHTAFDEETSQFHSPKDQQRWYDEVVKMLKKHPPLAPSTNH